MKITQEADYALRMVCRLAEQDGVVGAMALTAAASVPARFGVKILHKLSGAGLVRAVRGATGGYMLSVDAGHLTLRQVIEAIDGPIALRHCLESGKPWPSPCCSNGCRLHCLFGALNEMLIQRLDRVTVAMVVDQSCTLEQLLHTVE
jgi:Rrf2 family protein